MKFLLFILITLVIYIIYKLSNKPTGTNESIDYTARGYKKFKERDYTGAIEDYTRTIESEPRNWIALNNRGNTYSVMLHDAHTNDEKLRLIELAMEDFAKSLEIKPRNEGNHKAYQNLRELQRDLKYIAQESKEETLKAEEQMEASKEELKSNPVIISYLNAAKLKLSNIVASTGGSLRKKDVLKLYQELASELVFDDMSFKQKDELIQFVIWEAIDEINESTPIEIVTEESLK